MIIKWIKGQKNLILVLALYLFLSAILFANFKYMINPDGIAYISIAKDYLNGHIFYAINGYWSPLYSWILIPFICIWPGNLGNVMVAKILAIIIGLFVFVAVYLIVDKLNFNNYLKMVILFALIPIMLHFSLNFIMPDLLVTCILLYYLNFLMDEKYRKTIYMGLLTGLLGVLAFLAKSYVFYFFLIHFILTNLFYIKKFPLDKSNVKKNLLMGLSVFLIISGVWSGVISEKYQTITIGTTGSYNYALVGPESNGPAVYQGLINPTNEFSVSSWEDPSYLQMKKWNPLASPHNLAHQFMITANNINKLIFILSVLLVPVFAIVFALFFLFKSRETSIKNNIILILGTMVLYTAGYVMILIEERYLWFVLILSFILGFYCLKLLYEEKYIKMKFFRIIAMLLAVSLAFYPILSLHEYSGASKIFYEISLDLKSNGINGNLVSNDQWEIMNYFSYYLDSKYYGMTKNQSDSELKETLISHQIDYYFLWGGSSSKDFLGEIVYQTEYLTVYKIRK
ncbi:hypothetical protein DSECCO2_355830 [anaerobic digester metagenome]